MASIFKTNYTRIAPSDLEGLKKIASDKAIPYQTLLGSLIHEYVAGKLVDIEEIKKIFPSLKTKARMTLVKRIRKKVEQIISTVTTKSGNKMVTAPRKSNQE